MEKIPRSRKNLQNVEFPFPKFLRKNQIHNFRTKIPARKNSIRNDKMFVGNWIYSKRNEISIPEKKLGKTLPKMKINEMNSLGVGIVQKRNADAPRTNQLKKIVEINRKIVN